MIKNMSGFIDPYSLGFVLSIVGSILFHQTHKDAQNEVNSGQQYEETSDFKKQQGSPSIHPDNVTSLSTLD